MRKYRPITHPSVSEIACPFCGMPKGTPCRKRDEANTGMPYTETHKVRVDRWAKETPKHVL